MMTRRSESERGPHHQQFNEAQNAPMERDANRHEKPGANRKRRPFTGRFGIRNTLTATLLFVAVLSLAFGGQSVYEEFDAYREATRIEDLNQTTNHLFQAVKNYGYERGRTNVVLNDAGPVSGTEKNRSFVFARRKDGDRELDEALKMLSVLCPTDYDSLTAKVLQPRTNVERLRLEVDRDMTVQKRFRDPRLPRIYFQTMTDYIEQIGDLLFFISRDISDAEGLIARLTQIKLHALGLRDTAGPEMSRTAATIKSDARLSEDEVRDILKLHGETEVHWAELKRSTSGLAYPDISRAMEEFNEIYSKEYRPLFTKVFPSIIAGGPYEISQEDVLKSGMKVLESIAGIMDASVSATDRYASQMKAAAYKAFVFRLAMLAANFLLILGCILFVHLRVAAPITRMTRVMKRVAQGEHDVVVPGSERRDEIGEMAEAVEVFRQNDIQLELEVNALKKAEETIRESEERLRKSHEELELRILERTEELVNANQSLSEKAEIIDLAHDAIIVRDVEGRIVFWSRGAQETYGFAGEEALGKVCSALLKTVFPVAIETILKTVLEKGEWKGELKHTKANGERIIVDSRWAMHTGRGGEGAGYLEINRDITSRKIVEEELRKMDRAFRTLSECNQAMVRQTREMALLQEICRILIDVGGYRMAWVGFRQNDENKSVLPITSAGYDQGYLGQARVSWADTDRGKGPTGTAIRTGKICVSQNALLNPEYRLWRSEGTRRGFSSSIALPLIIETKVIGALTIYASEPDAFDEGEASLLSNLAENLAYGIASIRIGEQRKRSEEDLRVYTGRLEVLNEELQDFVFAASHDLQEPLRKIQTFCDMVTERSSSGLDKTGKEYLGRVLVSAGRMRQLLQDLLTFSSTVSKPKPFQQLRLDKVAREAAGIFEASIEQTGCRIDIDDLPVIEADESQILQLFQNLIGNALKYHGSESPRIKIYGGIDGQGSCRICVEDNGIGFDLKYAERIFKPFQRLHGRSEYDGTGMGLAICRKIVERHRGTIAVDSEPGKGTVFTVRLPVSQTKPGRDR